MTATTTTTSTIGNIRGYLKESNNTTFIAAPITLTTIFIHHTVRRLYSLCSGSASFHTLLLFIYLFILFISMRSKANMRLNIYVRPTHKKGNKFVLRPSEWEAGEIETGVGGPKRGRKHVMFQYGMIEYEDYVVVFMTSLMLLPFCGYATWSAMRAV